MRRVDFFEKCCENPYKYKWKLTPKEAAAELTSFWRYRYRTILYFIVSNDDKVSCSMTKRNASDEDRTLDLLI